MIYLIWLGIVGVLVVATPVFGLLTLAAGLTIMLKPSRR